MFSNPFPNAFGLDIGDLSIKLVQLRNTSFFKSTPSYKLITHRSIDIPPGLIVNGEMQKPEEVRKLLEILIKGNKKDKPIKGPWVVASLPETQGFIKLIETNTIPAELTDIEINELAKKHIPYDDDGSYYIEWQIMPSQDKTTRILIGSVQKSIADSYTYLLESLGLGVIALEIEALAVARAMITASKEYENEARALLDLGATRSSLIIYDKDIIQFSISLPFSGEIISTTLAQRLHISYEDAELTKTKQGLNYRNKDSRAWGVLNKVTNDLIKYIKEAINFYYSHFPEANKITRITMCGGGSNMKKLNKILSSKLKVVAKPGHPWKNLSSSKTFSIPEDESLTYSTAIGLALRAADNPFFTHDAI